jgi:hypothetical protein
MKIKRLSKKLGLNKKTIAHLETSEMNHVFGGDSQVLCTIGGGCTNDCETFPIIRCTTGCPQPTV